MSELVMLTQLVLKQWRWKILLTLTYLIVSCVIALMVSRTGIPMVSTTWVQQNMTLLLCFATLLPLVIGFAMFDMGIEKHVDERGCAYPGWLLRSPVATWKLAIVPAFLKTAWFVSVFALIGFTSQSFNNPIQRWIGPAISMSCLVLFAHCVVWRPFVFRYSRLAMAFALVIPGLLWFGMSFRLAILEDLNSFFGRSFVGHSVGSVAATEPMIFAAILLAYGFGLWYSIRCLRRGRSDVVGRIPEPAFRIGNSISDAESTAANDESALPRKLRRPATTSHSKAVLDYHVALLSRNLGTKFAAAVWATVLLATAFIFPTIEIQGVVLLVVMMWMIAAMLTQATYSSVESKGLPIMMMVSPISSAEFAWTRQATSVLIALFTMSGLLLLSAAWSVTGAADAMLTRLTGSVAATFGQETSLSKVGLATTMMVLLLLIHQVSRSVIQLSVRNQRLEVFLLAAKTVAFFGTLAFFLAKFMQFTDWESWLSWLSSMTGTLRFLILLLAVSTIATASVHTYRLTNRRLASRRSLVLIWGFATVACIAGGTFMSSAFPVSFFAKIHWLALMIVILPIRPILSAPLVIAESRHGS